MTLFEIKNKIDNIMYFCFNGFSELMYFFKFTVKKAINNNEKYLNIHKDERCFILGTGPSLSGLDKGEIEKLKKEKTFAVNSFFKSAMFRDITPNYYILVDDVFWRDTWVFSIEDVKNHYKNKTTIITDYRAINLSSNSEDFENMIFLHCKKYPFDSINIDISKNMYAAINVVSYGVLCAIYMGFKEIYLLGCDYNSFATEIDEHCYDDEDEQYEINNRLGMLLSFYARATEIHYLIRKYADRNGVKIINLTSGSLLDSYEKSTLSKVLR